EIINEHLGLLLSGFHTIVAYCHEKPRECVTLNAMVQEDMFVQALGDTDTGTDIPDFSSCRILPFNDDEQFRSQDDRLMRLIRMLDK
ncbi:MAG: hypothetical protein RBT68_04105, partial [Spirochaetia bacterium]|nr:hypothetical protein [Spirochaetia bacterium]